MPSTQYLQSVHSFHEMIQTWGNECDRLWEGAGRCGHSLVSGAGQRTPRGQEAAPLPGLCLSSPLTPSPLLSLSWKSGVTGFLEPRGGQERGARGPRSADLGLFLKSGYGLWAIPLDRGAEVCEEGPGLALGLRKALCRRSGCQASTQGVRTPQRAEGGRCQPWEGGPALPCVLCGPRQGALPQCPGSGRGRVSS